MKSELQKVREWAEARLKSGDVADWAWQDHVALIEAIDTVLHDMSMARSDSGRPSRLLTRTLRLVERAEEPSGSEPAQKTSALH